MNKRWLIRIITIIFALVLPIAEMFFHVVAHLIDDDLKFVLLIAVLFFLATILAEYLFHLAEKIKNERIILKQENQAILDQLNFIKDHLSGQAIMCYTVNKKDLYEKLKSFSESATEKIELMYLGERPPDKIPKFESRDTYLSSLDEVINTERIQITRIFLYNNSNKTYIRKLANKYKGKRYFSLYILTENLIPSFSIQLIDSTKIVIVNTSKSTTLNKKHLVIESSEANLIYTGFYKDIKSNASAVVINGEIQPEVYNRYLA